MKQQQTLTVSEVAANEKVTTKTIYDWIKQKKITGFQMVGVKKDKYVFNAVYKVKYDGGWISRNQNTTT